VPIIASIPLLIVYFSSQGNTNVVVPIPLRPFLGSLIHLGPVYYVYMSLLSTFATNSINILAGINGAEVAQSIVIGASVVVFRVVEGEGEGGFTLYFMIPLVAVSLAFAYHNWFVLFPFLFSFLPSPFSIFASLTQIRTQVPSTSLPR